MTKEQRKRASELFIRKYEATVPKRADETVFEYFARAFEWITTPEGGQAFRDAALQAEEGI